MSEQKSTVELAFDNSLYRITGDRPKCNDERLLQKLIEYENKAIREEAKAQERTIESAPTLIIPLSMSTFLDEEAKESDDDMLPL